MNAPDLAAAQHAARARQEARDRVFLAAATAGVQAVFLLAFQIVPRLRTGEWAGVVDGMLLGPVLVAWLGYALHRWESRIAAVLLLAGVVLAFAQGWVERGHPSGLLVYGGLAFIHLRGVLGALHLADAREAQARSSLPPEPPTAP